MASLNSIFSQPDDVLELQPDRERITSRGATAWHDIWGPSPPVWSAAAANTWNHRNALFWHALLRAYELLGDLNNLLLPPLFTLIIIEFANGGLPHMMSGEVQHANYLFCITFISEWVIGCALARSHWAYVRNLWLLGDLLSALPLAYVFQAARLARAGRLLRFAKLLKLVRARRFKFPFARFARAIGIAGSTTVAGAFAFEAVEPTTVTGLREALWWSIVTVTTVGYGDIAPATGPGRVIAVILMATGVGVFSYLAGLMASAVFDPGEDYIMSTVSRIETQLDDIIKRLDEQEVQRNQLDLTRTRSPKATTRSPKTTTSP